MKQREQSEESPKRTRMRAEERRELILQHAKQVFARTNFAEASTSELARESGITEPMLYKHFGSKKGLFLAVLCEFGLQFCARFSERIQKRAKHSIQDALEHVIDDYRELVKADPDIDRAFFQAIVESHDPMVADAVNQHNRKVYGYIHQLIMQAQQEGYLSVKLDSEVAAWGYMSIIISGQYGRMLNRSQDVARLQPEVSRIWLQGLLASAEVDPKKRP